MSRLNLLVVVDPDRRQSYVEGLARYDELSAQVLTDVGQAREILSDRDHPIDILVLDNAMHDVHTLLAELRQSYPRLLIILVDEDADFGLPGQADEFVNAPFEGDALFKCINRLTFERHQATLRSDSLPAIRSFARKVRGAPGMGGKQQAAVDTVQELGYAYVAYYHLDQPDPPQLRLRAQAGPRTITTIAPDEGQPGDLMHWIIRNNQSRVASYGEDSGYPLVASGRLGCVAGVPVVFDSVMYGVLLACQEQPHSIAQENVAMLELIGTQLASALAREMLS